MLEVYFDGEWLLGRYEWTTMSGDAPTLTVGDRVFWLDGSQLFRWPLPTALSVETRKSMI